MKISNALLTNILTLFCVVWFVALTAAEGNDTGVVNDEIVSGADYSPEFSAQILETVRPVVILGAFATAEEPQLSTEVDSKCPLTSSINQRFEFNSAEKVYFGLAIKNRSNAQRSLTVIFVVSGRNLILNESMKITIPSGGTCLPFTSLPTGIPDGLYKLSGGLLGRGSANIIVSLDDDNPLPGSTPVTSPAHEATPTPTATPPISTPEPSVTATPVPTGTPTPLT